MQTTVINKPTYDLANGVRKPGSLEQIATITVQELLNHIKADNFKIVSNAEGTRFMHLENQASGDYFSVKVGKKVTTTKRGVDLVKDLVENHTVYTGVTENGVWFTFGPEPAANEPVVEVSLADLIAKGISLKQG